MRASGSVTRDDGVPMAAAAAAGGPGTSSSPAQGDEFVRNLLEKYGRDLRNYAWRLAGRNPEKTEDLVQETLLRAWRYAHTRRGPERPWIMTILKNASIDGSRAEWSRPVTSGSGELSRIPVAPAEDQILESAMLRQALACLPLEHREVIHQVYYQGASIRETAVKLGVAEGTIKSRLHYARQHLRQLLTEQGISRAA